MAERLSLDEIEAGIDGGWPTQSAIIDAEVDAQVADMNTAIAEAEAKASELALAVSNTGTAVYSGYSGYTESRVRLEDALEHTEDDGSRADIRAEIAQLQAADLDNYRAEFDY